MTREEVKEMFKSILDGKSQFDAYGIEATEYNLKVNEKFFDALDMAIKVLEQEPCEEHQREFIELVVEYPNPDLCTYPEYRGKPYFSIKYRENGKYIVGFGSYKIEMISQWIKEYFIPSIQPKTDVLDKIRAEIEEIEKNYGFDKATKYGNKNAEQQSLSYSTMMMYEIADIIDEIKEIIDKYKVESEDKE